MDDVALDAENSNAPSLSTNDDVDCDAVNVFKFEIDVTKLAVEILAVNVFNELKSVDCETIPDGLFAMLSQVVCVILPLKTYLSSYEDVNWELPLIKPLNDCSFVAATISLCTDAEKSLKEDVCNLALIPFVKAVFNISCDWVNEFREVISVWDELINPNADICADELIILLPLLSNEDVADSKDDNLLLSNMFTREVTASAKVSNSIL
jgi:hypothetical protein